MNLKTILFFFPFLIFASCNPHISNLSVDSSFTSCDLKEGKLTFWGITNADRLWPLKEENQYNEIAGEALARDREEVIGYVGKQNPLKLDRLDAARIDRQFLSEKSIKKESLDKIMSALSTRYVLFSKIQNDDIIHQHRKEVQEKDGEKKYTIIYTSTRELTVHTEIYDLFSSILVWSGEITRTGTKTNRNPHYHEKNIVKDIAAELFEDNYFGTYPKPYPLEKLFKRAFTGIAASLPNGSCVKQAERL